MLKFGENNICYLYAVLYVIIKESKNCESNGGYIEKMGGSFSIIRAEEDVIERYI